MNTRTIRTAIVAVTSCIALMPTLSLARPHDAAHSVSLVQQPVVMRLSKDEFRIAFGLDAASCASSERGCSGTIRYRVDWKADDGTLRSEVKRVNYALLPQSSRGLTVDRQYFDTAEGAHHTEVVRVSVAAISCVDGNGSDTIRTAALASN